MSEEGSKTNKSDCGCYKGKFASLTEYKQLGEDSRYGEVSVHICQHCHQYWLFYLYEQESFSRSGQWYRGPISNQQAESLSAEEAVAILQELDWYYCGGSYYDGQIGKKSGRLSQFFYE